MGPSCCWLSLSLPNGPMNKESGHGGRDGGYAGDCHITLLINADLVTTAVECQICQLQRQTLSPNMAPRVTSQIRQVDYTGPLLREKGNTLPLLE